MRDREYIKRVEQHVVRLQREIDRLASERGGQEARRRADLDRLEGYMACGKHEWMYETVLPRGERIIVAYLFRCKRCGCPRRVLLENLTRAERSAIAALGIGHRMEP